MTLPLNQIIQGDCVDILKTFPENNIDCIVTDPPYGLNFMGKAWDKALPPKQAFIEMCRVLKPGALAFVMSSPRQDLMWRMAQLLEESGFELGQSFISWVYASGFPKAFDIASNIDKKKGLKGKNIGTKKITSHVERRDSNITNQFYEGTDSAFTSKKIRYDIEPASSEAKAWSGWKSVTGLKPALEMVFMVQKPMSEKTIVDNVLKWGVGAMNVDGCRIPFQNKQDIGDPDRGKGYPLLDVKKGFNQNKLVNNITIGEKGRFPANLLVSDDILNDGKVTQSNIRQPTGNQNIYDVSRGWNDNQVKDTTVIGVEDSGSFSRYFDLDAWARHHGILQVPKASTSERDDGLTGEKKDLLYEDGRWGSHEIFSNKYTESSGNPSNRGQTPKRINIHPTVKPIKLMAYLIELGCPPKGIVIDPFVGSGTTCIAAKQLSRNYIGIEISSEYAEIAKKRIESYFENLDMVFE